ncbi:hypothetical protein DENSPDRAFT_398923 [Dentipellis sp. KUC8613]|nr:hypothetical protein DENSPDRAFT_398923 [Dentipellis sp. KUC8613]
MHTAASTFRDNGLSPAPGSLVFAVFSVYGLLCLAVDTYVPLAHARLPMPPAPLLDPAGALRVLHRQYIFVPGLSSEAFSLSYAYHLPAHRRLLCAAKTHVVMPPFLHIRPALLPAGHAPSIQPVCCLIFAPHLCLTKLSLLAPRPFRHSAHIHNLFGLLEHFDALRRAFEASTCSTAVPRASPPIPSVPGRLQAASRANSYKATMFYLLG